MMTRALSGWHQPPSPNPDTIIIGSFSASKQLIHIRALFPLLNKQQTLRRGSDTGGGGRGLHIRSSLTTLVLQNEERRNETRKTTCCRSAKPPSRSQGPHQKRESRNKKQRERQKNRLAGRSGEVGCRSRSRNSNFLAPLFTVAALPCVRLRRHPS